MACELASAALILASVHSAPGFQAATPGVILRGDCGAVGGIYRNSLGKASILAGWSFEAWPDRLVGVFAVAGAVTGYGGLKPFGMAGGRLRLGADWQFRGGVIPYVPKANETWTVTFMLERSL